MNKQHHRLNLIQQKYVEAGRLRHDVPGSYTDNRLVLLSLLRMILTAQEFKKVLLGGNRMHKCIVYQQLSDK